MSILPPSPFISSAGEPSPAEASPAEVSGKDHDPAGDRFVLDEARFLADIEPLPLFLQRTG